MKRRNRLAERWYDSLPSTKCADIHCSVSIPSPRTPVSPMVLQLPLTDTRWAISFHLMYCLDTLAKACNAMRRGATDGSFDAFSRPRFLLHFVSQHALTHPTIPCHTLVVLCVHDLKISLLCCFGSRNLFEKPKGS